ncbi:hypothetical protein FHX42_002654 [Saccharopolyspora lacisalsi]|uniref:Uncharacterized protein n=1 Tax=Halosaccharopolyspora lacisalsi TaxID=1000566 RepID=A0A839DWA8_9PSEU|nr:hypothetical protein [Halosaccharopolyspora lacisalsi]MBA8825303.1 hypothetical protein [Halosaccharopolyspora lacisalsi]
MSDANPARAVEIPGVDEIVNDRLAAVQAACQVTGPPSDSKVVRQFADEFTRWLKHGHDHTDRLLRRHVLLTITAGRANTGTSDRDAAKLVKIADDLYSYIA